MSKHHSPPQMLRCMASIILFLCLSITSWADKPAELHIVDSLLGAYLQAGRSQKLVTGRQLMDIYTRADAFLDEAPMLKAEMPEDSMDLAMYYATERFYVINAYYSEALTFNDRAQEKGSAQQPDIHATLLCDRGYCLYKTSQLAQAAEVEQQAMRYAKQTGNLMQLSRAYLYLAIVNVNISVENRPQAKEFILKSIETNKRLGMNRQLHNVLGVASEVFCASGEIEKAIEYGLQAVEAAEAIHYDAGVANHLSQLSYAYNRNKQYQLGLETAQRAIDMVEAMEIPDRNLLAISMEFKGWNLLDMGHNAEAAEVLRQAADIEQEVGNTRAVCYDMKVICEALEPIDPQGALQALKRYTAMADSMHTAQLQGALGQANAGFRNDELQEENAQERRLRRIILGASLTAILLLFVAAAALWWASWQKTRANQTLRKLQNARDSFFTNVTHEFRTPLTVILGMSRELQRTTSPADAAKAGALIQRQGDQLLNLVNQLLDISKVGTTIGKQPMQTADITAYAEMVVESFNELAREKGINLMFKASERPLVVDFVPDYLNKILNNLLGNALKFTGEGGQIEASVTRERNRLRLTVSDTGIGIAAEDLPLIFQPFYQSDPESGIGSGVGLTLVRQIVDALHGSITAESEKDKGTTFRIELPLTKTQGSHTTSLSPSHVSVREESKVTRHSSLKNDSSLVIREEIGIEAEEIGEEACASILIVEDNADVAYYISSLLQDRYSVVQAADGREGLAKARELMPDLIITDLMMPHTDGLELCRQIRADVLTNHIPVIVVTAKATDGDRLRGLEAGADAYLYKPFNAEELHVRVEKLLEQRRLLHEKYAREWQTADITDHSVSDKATPHEGTSTATNGIDIHTEGILLNAGTKVSKREQAEKAFLAKINGFIEELMPKGEADIEHIASALCMSPSQFRRKFSVITGVTPAQYILHVRLEHARQLLLSHPEWTIADVAEQCGFADQPHFTRVFRRIYGITPGQFAHEGQDRAGQP